MRLGRVVGSPVHRWSKKKKHEFPRQEAIAVPIPPPKSSRRLSRCMDRIENDWRFSSNRHVSELRGVYNLSGTKIH